MSLYDYGNLILCGPFEQLNCATYTGFSTALAGVATAIAMDIKVNARRISAAIIRFGSLVVIRQLAAADC